MKLVKCPLCRSEPERIQNGWYGCFGCGLVSMSRHGWNRLVKDVRKGRMFEWLERSEPKSTPKGVLRNFVILKAREWWRNREKGGR